MHPFTKTVGGLTATLPSEREIRVVRSFKAPRQLVWDAHTQPHLLKKWLVGPPGWVLKVCTVDLRVGGGYRYEWHSDKGLAMAMSGTYRAVDAPGHMADTQMFDDNWTQGPANTNLTFSEDHGVTTLTLDILYASEAARDLALSVPMLEGMEAGYGRLDTLDL